MSLTDWIGTCRAADHRLNLADLSTTQWTLIVNQALYEFSLYQPRGWRYTTITVNAGDTMVALPDDYVWANPRDLDYLATGTLSPIQPIDGTWPLSPLQPISSGYAAPIDRVISTDDGRFAVVLPTAATTTYSATLPYMAGHQISDPDTNTVPIPLRGILQDLCLGRAAEIRAKNALIENKPDLSREYQQIARQYLMARRSLWLPMGEWTHASK